MKKGNSLSLLRRIAFDISGKLERYSEHHFSGMTRTAPMVGPCLFIYLSIRCPVFPLILLSHQSLSAVQLSYCHSTHLECAYLRGCQQSSPTVLVCYSRWKISLCFCFLILPIAFSVISFNPLSGKQPWWTGVWT